MKTVWLTWAELIMAASAGVLRRVQNAKHRTEQRFGSSRAESSWQNEIIGCIGEVGLAKYKNRFWMGAIGNYRAADTSRIYHVRATECPNGRLIIHKEDPDDAPFVLARVRENEVTLVGWLYGREGKRSEWWYAPPNHPNWQAFFVPNDELHDMDDLPEEPAPDVSA